MNELSGLETAWMQKKLPDIRVGDEVKIHVKVKEGDKERVQIFQGVIIKLHNAQLRSTMTVRKVSFGIGVERIFPFYTPTIDKIEIVSRGQVRRAKLYYLRNLKGKKARLVADRNFDSVAASAVQAEPAEKATASAS